VKSGTGNSSIDANEREHEMQISARNQLKGTVKKVEHGAVNSEVTIELSGGSEIVSIITKQSAEQLQITVGSTVYAVIKASDVMVATD
jgi:molybdopterin-binding protein